MLLNDEFELCEVVKTSYPQKGKLCFILLYKKGPAYCLQRKMVDEGSGFTSHKGRQITQPGDGASYSISALLRVN